MNGIKGTVAGLAVAWAVAAAVAADVAQEDWSRIYLGSNPSVDGEGRRFAFEWNEQIWLADVKGGTARRLGSGASADSWPVMSADGAKVVFASDREGGLKVFEYDLTRDAVRQITHHSETTYPRAWCPDGRRLLCAGWRDASGPKGGERILIVRTDARKAETMPFDLSATDPAMSPDGSALLFRYRGDEAYRKRPRSKTPAAGQIWRYTFATGAFDPLVVRDADCRNPVWQPDGQGFYYLNAEGGARNVWRKNLLTGEDRQLTFFTDDHVFQPSLSADGRTLLFRQKFDFWRFDPTRPEIAPARIPLRPEPGYAARPETRRRFYDACWNNDSPGDASFCDNGMQVAFTTGGDLFVMDTVVREPTLVHGETRTHERECAFSPDGGALYYLSDRGDATRVIRAAPADPSKPWWENTEFRRTTLVDDGAQRRGLSVSPDGSRLAWEDPNGILTFADTNGVTISRGPAASKGGFYAWSPDGRWVAAQLEDAYANPDVWILSVDGKTSPYNLSRSFKFDGEPAWSPDGQIVAFASECPDLGEGKFLRYVYLDRELEERETRDRKLDDSRKSIRDNAVQADRYKGLSLPVDGVAKKPLTADMLTDDLAARVRAVKCNAAMPFFKWDSRTIAFVDSAGATSSVCVPSRTTAEKLFACKGAYRNWIEKDNRLLWVVDNLPAIGERRLKFKVYQNTHVQDYQELAFRTAWARIRDVYYDPGTHGADWGAVGARYLMPARMAPSPSVFGRVMRMTLGELDSSHLGFYSTARSDREWGRKTKIGGWVEQTAHLGLRFRSPAAPDGWVVSDVVPGGPADRPSFGIRPGDLVTHVDGTPVGGDMDPTLVLNGPAGRSVRVTFRRGADGPKTVVVPSFSYADARKKIGDETVRAARRTVHARSGGRFGYLNIDAMNQESLWLFQREVFAEGYGRDGLVIDVRNNFGGWTADRMLQILCGADHSRSVTRTCGAGYLAGYWARPVWSKPIVVLCSEKTASNGEIFSHAVKTLKRGKLVGRRTDGGVIGTNESSILDMGGFRDARFGWFLLDGTDMENHGAQPDHVVEDEPGDVVRGVDRQLDKALEVLGEEVEAWRKAHRPIDFKYAR